MGWRQQWVRAREAGSRRGRGGSVLAVFSLRLRGRAAGARVCSWGIRFCGVHSADLVRVGGGGSAARRCDGERFGGREARHSLRCDDTRPKKVHVWRVGCGARGSPLAGVSGPARVDRVRRMRACKTRPRLAMARDLE
eukprot:641060-Pleurochrysis_carterae.AAC.2